MEDALKTFEAAMAIYNKMFDCLVESVSNSAKSCEGATWYQDERSIHYLQGKVSAYREVANRILKERRMVLSNISSDRKLYRKLDKIFRGMQIDSLDEILPDDKVRGNATQERLKRRLVEGFWNEMLTSFQLGIKFAELRAKPEYESMTEEELYKKLLESAGIKEETLEYLDKLYKDKP